MWCDSFTRDMTHSHEWHDTFTCVIWLMWYTSFIRVTWRIYMSDMSRPYRWLIHLYDMIRSYIWHYSGTVDIPIEWCCCTCAFPQFGPVPSLNLLYYNNVSTSKVPQDVEPLPTSCHLVCFSMLSCLTLLYMCGPGLGLCHFSELVCDLLLTGGRGLSPDCTFLEEYLWSQSWRALRKGHRGRLVPYLLDTSGIFWQKQCRDGDRQCGEADASENDAALLGQYSQATGHRGGMSHTQRRVNSADGGGFDSSHVWSVPGSTRVITHRGVFKLRAGVQK